MNHSTPGLPVHHQLPEFTQTRVRRVSLPLKRDKNDTCYFLLLETPAFPPVTLSASDCESPGAVTNRGAVLSHLPPAGSSTGGLLKYRLGLSVKEAYLLILELSPEGQASGLVHI